MAIKNKLRKFVSNIQVGAAGMDEAGLRALAQNDPKAFMDKTCRLVDEGKMRWDGVKDLKRMFHALADVQVPACVNVMGRTRSIQASAFPLLAGTLTVAGINDAYEAVPTIGQDLVRERDDNKKVTTVASILSEDTGTDRVDEGKDFPEIGAGEEKYTIAHKRNGRRISITAEMIEENDVGGIIERVNALGEIRAEMEEEQTLRRVCDIDGSGSSAAEPYVLHNPAAASLYTTTANSPGTRAPSGTRINNNALVDTTNLDTARSRLAGMLNSRAKRIAIPVSRMTLLVPDALAGVASKLMNSELEPGVENEINNWGPRGRYRPRLLTSPKLDDLSTTTWYLGWFERQFMRKHKLRAELITIEGTTESFLRSRVAYQSRIAWDMEIGATDYVFVTQCLSGTTAP